MSNSNGYTSIVTTSLKPTFDQSNKALQLAKQLKVPFLKRQKNSIRKMIEENEVDNIVIVSNNDIICYHSGGEFFFHPDKSRLRIKEIKAGKTDQMIKAMALKPGDTLIDCTLGLGTDAIVASFVVGDQGRITGIEKSSIVATLVKYGLEGYIDNDKDIENAMRRIEVLCEDHNKYLYKAKAGSFDVVYFDPMFREPIKKGSNPVNGLRPLAEHNFIREESIHYALKVAKKRVVMKERRDSEEFRRLGVDMIVGGKNSPVCYGIWLKEKVNSE